MVLQIFSSEPNQFGELHLGLASQHAGSSELQPVRIESADGVITIPVHQRFKIDRNAFDYPEVCFFTDVGDWAPRFLKELMRGFVVPDRQERIVARIEIGSLI